MTDGAADLATADDGSTPAPPISVHLLIVHGVGRHHRLANLLRAYQSLRANVTSTEAPTRGEDQIPGWRLTRFEEGASPPFLKLEPRSETLPGMEPLPGSVGAVYLYEVNYSSFAGVVRENHPIDLTALFVGLDLAVCAARQRPQMPPTALAADTARLGRCLQRASGVLAVATVPIVGLPSLLLRNYTRAFVATFARFFEDVATFALDKNGEQLISAHFDRTVATIAANMSAGDRFVLAAHSLGSVVAHNYVVRHWAAGPGRLPETFVTFGSPIGLLTWAWLFLDFNNMSFGEPVDTPYFCWNPVSISRKPAGDRRPNRQVLSWINVVNCVDPIATVIPLGAVDLSVQDPERVASGLTGRGIVHRFLGPATARAVGRSHTEYFNDKEGFVAILLREAGLTASSDDDDTSDARSEEAHWTDTESILRRVQWGVYAVALLAVAAYCGIVARRFGDARLLTIVLLFAWPAVTIGVLAFFQRLLMGGPTKRVTTDLIRKLHWINSSSFPYRLREGVLALIRRSRDVDPMQPSPGRVARTLGSVISFVPALVAMLIPVVVGAWLAGQWPTAESVWMRLATLETLLALALFMIYVICCAAYELIRTWREVIQILIPT